MKRGYFRRLLGVGKFRDGRGLILSRWERSEKRWLHEGILRKNFLIFFATDLTPARLARLAFGGLTSPKRRGDIELA